MDPACLDDGGAAVAVLPARLEAEAVPLAHQAQDDLVAGGVDSTDSMLASVMGIGRIATIGPRLCCSSLLISSAALPMSPASTSG